ncbi:hypothetical protein SSX86_032728 [Deinandra increscens subsp. villosa]|uniref:Exostosin GT47 domain-containing protein n=1 Tax=Deinandra increscens subsp. villosa TaxID=3103831 RepID=A0AAP0C736_9ASTR
MATVLKGASFRGLFFMISTSLIILKLIFFSITSFSSTSNLMITDNDDHRFADLKPPHHQSPEIFNTHPLSIVSHEHGSDHIILQDQEEQLLIRTVVGDDEFGPGRPSVKPLNVKEVYHEKDIFLDNYKQMNKTMKIYVYPHAKTDPFANVFLPDNSGSPGGNYASESYFKIALSMSHFVALKTSSKTTSLSISHKYPFWNRTGGADHFYVACHSVGRTAMEKAPEVRINAIQAVCSSSYFLQGYTAHKDASIPQIWPRLGVRPTRHPSKREMLAFYAGAMNSRVRESLVQTWINDSDIGVHQTRLKTPYSESLLGSKFCIHAKGFEVNTARIGDAIYYGCVPVILADHYDLPFGDILNWNSFAVVVSTQDIGLLKRILNRFVDSDEYLELQKNVLQVQKHFQWHKNPVDFDTFYMVMYELWMRRSSVRIHLFN